MALVMLDRDTIVEHVGELDDLTISRIQQTGADEADLIEAVAWVEGDEELEQLEDAPTTQAAAEVYVILRAHRDAEELDEENYLV